MVPAMIGLDFLVLTLIIALDFLVLVIDIALDFLVFRIFGLSNLLDYVYRTGYR
jgi:hypothetical protein